MGDKLASEWLVAIPTSEASNLLMPPNVGIGVPGIAGSPRGEKKEKKKKERERKGGGGSWTQKRSAHRRLLGLWKPSFQ